MKWATYRDAEEDCGEWSPWSPCRHNCERTRIKFGSDCEDELPPSPPKPKVGTDWAVQLGARREPLPGWALRESGVHSGGH